MGLGACAQEPPMAEGPRELSRGLWCRDLRLWSLEQLLSYLHQQPVDIHVFQMPPITSICISAPEGFCSTNLSMPLCPGVQLSTMPLRCWCIKPQLLPPLGAVILGQEGCTFSPWD